MSSLTRREAMGTLIAGSLTAVAMDFLGSGAVKRLDQIQQQIGGLPKDAAPYQMGSLKRSSGHKGSPAGRTGLPLW